MAKHIIVTFGDQVYQFLKSEAKARGINVQALLRAIIIPDWSMKARKPLADRAASGLKQWLDDVKQTGHGNGKND